MILDFPGRRSCIHSSFCGLRKSSGWPHVQIFRVKFHPRHTNKNWLGRGGRCTILLLLLKHMEVCGTDDANWWCSFGRADSQHGHAAIQSTPSVKHHQGKHLHPVTIPGLFLENLFLPVPYLQSSFLIYSEGQDSLWAIFHAQISLGLKI